VSSATATDNREVRHFELEADRRARRMFVMIVVAFALLAIGGGIFAAWLILSDDTPIAALPPTKPKPPEAVRDFEPEAGVPWGEAKPVREPVRQPSKLGETLSDGDIGNGMRRMQAALDECARKHGAIDETTVHIDFSVNPSGRVDESDARPPFGKTPLGLCVADVVRTKGSFKASRSGRRDIRWSIKLRRRDG
jgi:hypothetical protein